MLFNSIPFAIFFIITFLLYLVLNHKWQNRLLLVASCIFYGIWDWRFLFFIFISITTDHICGLKIHKASNEKAKAGFLLLSLFVNLSILGIFKYYNFFIVNAAQLVNFLGGSIHPHLLKIIVPIGISFYTFRTISYTIDVFTERIKPTQNYFDYALFIVFFPVILMGPIVRAEQMLPQISSPRKLSLNQFYEGCYLIFWGLFQKIFIADNLAKSTNQAFMFPSHNGLEILIAVYAYTFQMYADFAGYSNIARGLGKCMGFEIMFNFNLPYFSTNPQDFWNRWHISLSTWLRDYIYTPISISKRHWGLWSFVTATMITFIICGLWHGAAWNYVLWGMYWGVLLILYKFLQPLTNKIPVPKGEFLETIWLSAKILFFFQFVCLSLLIFRVQSLVQIWAMLHNLVFNFSFIHAHYAGQTLLRVVFYVWILIAIEIYQFCKKDQMAFYRSPLPIKAIFYASCFYLMTIWGSSGEQEFIYMQF